MNRRRVLRNAVTATGAALVALPISGCRTTPLTTQLLPPVHAEQGRVIRVIAGLRPYRRSGFVIRSEQIGGKHVVHNYGHGGSGVTLSWGTAELAIKEALTSALPGPVAVLGCGVIGLSTAIRLQELGCTVTIYARELPPHTTSDIAGASWYPSLLVDADRRTAPFMEHFVRAARISHRRFQQLVGDAYGVRWRKQYAFADRQLPTPWPMEALPELFPTRELAAGTHRFPRPWVYIDDLMFIEMPIYLRALMRDFRQAGGTIRVRNFRDASAVFALPEQMIMNCTGLGSRQLFGDDELTPLKGQLVVLLPQPEVDYAVAFDQDYYMFPRRDGILLGGTRELGVESLSPNHEATARILSAHRNMFNSLQKTHSGDPLPGPP